MKTMKKLLAMTLAVLLVLGCFAGCNQPEDTDRTVATRGEGPITTDPVTLKVLTPRHPEATTDVESLWFFKYMEYWFKQQGYDVTFELLETHESQTTVSQMLGADSLPDIVWAIGLSAGNTVFYGQEEGMILDWTPYLTDEWMPNLKAQFDANPSMLAAHQAPNGGIYGLPYITPYPYSTIPGLVNRVFVRQSWLDQVGKKVPTTEEEFLDVLRAFKNIKLENGQKTIPLLSDVDFLEKYLWTCLGYYGGESAKYGTKFMIKDEQVMLPCYTEDYRDFIEIMHTLYTEGLIAPEYFGGMSGAEITGLIADGNGGMHAWWTLQYVDDDYADQVLLGPIPMGSNDDVYVSRLSDYTVNQIWASSKTKYPEIVAMMVDYLYSEEGSWLYQYGPKQGEDPLGLVDGWYYDEAGNITTKMVADGIYTAMELYCRDRIRSHDYAGLRVDPITTGTGEIITYKDAVTGADYYSVHDRTMTRSSNDEWWRLETIEKWSNYATSIRLPGAYFSSEETAQVTDYELAIRQYVVAESVKFITGKRPLSEIDAYFAKLKELGVEQYIKMYQDIYAQFIETTYGSKG